MRLLLFVMLAIDCLQFVAGLVAFRRARRSARAGAPSLARYSRSHGAILCGGALLLAVPVALGLTHVIASGTGVYSALVVELLGFLASRPAVKRLDAAHQARRPGALAG